MMRANPALAQQFAETAKAMQPHKFWDTQPVPKMRERRPEEEKAGVIEEKTIEDVSKDPQPLPAGFEWSTVDLSDDA
jgi:glycylpeptide N-tetradecanoyltransferase